MSFLAIDLGAESGRGILGSIEGGKLRVEEIHRFPNTPRQMDGSLRWDIDDLERHIRAAIARAPGNFVSVGVDAWGVDFVLLDGNGHPIEMPYHYRDSRTDGIMERALQMASREDIYRQTGIQFLPFNTLYQLYSMVLSRDPALSKAQCFLTIPDYFAHLLAQAAQPRCELTNATTTQCFNPLTSDWAWPLLETLGIPSEIFPPICQPGDVLGKLAGRDTGVIAPASHDTGSAVAAVPAAEEDWAFISSGTWSIVGLEVSAPVINNESCQAGFTNEGGVGGTFRFCKNVMGLWILQQCRAQWRSDGLELDYAALVGEAEACDPSPAHIDPDDPIFLKPGDMPARIWQWLDERGLAAPKTPGETARLVMESLARKYRVAVDEAARLSGRSPTVVFVIGGGSKNRLLNQLTADACRRPVLAGPAEATAIGNLLVQMIALGEISSVDEGRQLVRESVELTYYWPRT